MAQATVSSSVMTRAGPPVAPTVKGLPAVQETWVRSLGQEDPLEKGTATHSSLCSWLENPLHRGAWQSAVHGVTESDRTERLTLN